MGKRAVRLHSIYAEADDARRSNEMKWQSGNGTEGKAVIR